MSGELEALRRALVYWNNDHSGQHGTLRDEVAGIIERNAHAAGDQPYRVADLVISAVGARYDVVDKTLYDLIPEDEWGIEL